MTGDNSSENKAESLNELQQLRAALEKVRAAFDGGRPGLFCRLDMLRDAEPHVRAALLLSNSDPAKTECCPTCGGCGRIEKVPERRFEPGQRVIWHAGPNRFPASVIGYSASGKRLRIKTERWGSTYVNPLSVREAT